MASFSDSIKLTIDIVSGQTSSLKGFLNNAKSDIADAEGAFGKLKAAGGSAFDYLQANAGAFALGAGTALVGFGVKAVGTFQDAALGAGKLRDTLGLTAEEASRWEEVANDLGVGTDKLTTSFGFMEKTLGKTPQVFQQLGVEIARTADGSVDANQTFLNVIDTLHNITDPAERAAAAQKLLGKSWQDSSELIELGAQGVKERLADVQDEKIFTDEQIGQSRQFRDSLDNLQDAIEGVEIQIGEKLVPTLTQAVDTVTSLIGPVEKLHDGFEKFTNLPGLKQVYDNIAPWKQLPTRINQVKDAWHALFGGGGGMSKEELAAVNTQMTALWGNFTNGFGSAVSWARGVAQGATSQAEAARSAADAAAELESYKQTLAATTSESDKAKAASEGLSSALDEVFGSASDVQGAADEAQNKIASLGEAVKQNGNDFEGNTQKARDNRAALRDAVTGAEEYISTLAKSGATSDQVSATYAELRHQLVQQLQQFGLTEDQANNYIDTLGLTPDNVTTAVVLQGKENAKQQVLDYIQNSIDKVPAERRTELYGDLQRGDFDAALNLINSIPRTVVVRIQSQVSGALPRTGAVLSAEGRFVPGGSDLLTSVGEDGGRGGDEVILPLGNPGRMAELLSDPRVGPRVAAVLGGGAVGGAGAALSATSNNVFNIHMPPGTDAGQTVRALRRYVRYNGPAAVTF